MLVAFIIVTNVHKHELKNDEISPRNSDPFFAACVRNGDTQATHQLFAFYLQMTL